MRTPIDSVKILTALAAAAGAMALVATALPSASAGTISATLTRLPTSQTSPVDISAGATDWIYYYGVTTPSQADYKSPGPTSFSTTLTPETVPASGGYGPYTSGLGQTTTNLYLSFSGGTPDSSATADQNSWYAMAMQMTQTLLAPSEIVKLYLRNYVTNSTFSATLSSGGSYSATNVPLPTTGNSSFGLLTLNITGAVGDVLTFTDYAQASAIHANGNASVDIQAASATVAPEPAALSLMSLAGLGILLVGRRRGKPS